MAYAPESGSEEIRRIVKKRIKLPAMLESIEAALDEGLSLSCFFVLGFPDDDEQTLHESLGLARKLALMGLHDVGVAKFVPYPGSEIFERFLADGTIVLDDEYFLAVDAYAEGVNTRSFAPALTPRQLHLWQRRLLLSFYVISFLRHPLRTIRVALTALAGGAEETRYAKMLRDVVKTRCRWRRLLSRGGAEGG
jgi:hypothetical protein